jgi:SAM-dependent methyltransferase
MAGSLLAALRGFIEHWLPPPPARVLDVGCGDAESTRWLASRGYQPLGLDPRAPDEPGFRRGRLEGFRADPPFEAAVALRSLHHVHDLGAAMESLAGALEPGGRLVIFEFAIEAIDDRALRWSGERGLTTPATRAAAPEVLTRAVVREALESRFEELLAEPAPYLAHEGERPEHEPEEAAAIAAGELAPAGIRLVYRRR